MLAANVLPANVLTANVLAANVLTANVLTAISGYNNKETRRGNVQATDL